MAKKLEEWYKSPDVEKQREFVLDHVAPEVGEHILDIGTGPGMLAKSLAAAVGETGFVYGIDISSEMLELAKIRCQEYSWVIFEHGDACSLKHPSGGLFDCIVSTQVYEYVADIERALTEAYKILKPGGRIIILDTDFDSVVWYSKDTKRMSSILKVYDQHLIHPHLPQILAPHLKKCGFDNVQTKVHCICNTILKNSYSYGLLETVAKFVVTRGIDEDTANNWKREQMELNNTGQYFFSLNRYLFKGVK